MSNLYRREPAVIVGLVLGLVAAAGTAASQATHNGRVDWLVAAIGFLPVATGIIVRSGVFSPASVNALEEELKAALAATRAVNVNVHSPELDQAIKVADEVLAAIHDAETPTTEATITGKIEGS